MKNLLITAGIALATVSGSAYACNGILCPGATIRNGSTTAMPDGMGGYHVYGPNGYHADVRPDHMGGYQMYGRGGTTYYRYNPMGGGYTVNGPGY